MPRRQLPAGRTRGGAGHARRRVRRRGRRRQLPDGHDRRRRRASASRAWSRSSSTRSRATGDAPSAAAASRTGAGITFWPLVEIVREAAGIVDEDAPDVARGKIASLVGDADGDRAGRGGGRLWTTATSRSTELFWGVRKLIESIASERPLALSVRRHPLGRGDAARPDRRTSRTTIDGAPLLVAVRDPAGSARAARLARGLGRDRRAGAARRRRQPAG